MTATASGPSHRLPRALRPVRYDLHLDADPARPGFTGTLSLALEATEPVRELRLHAKRLRLATARLEQDGRTQDLEILPDEAHEAVTLRAPAPLRPGPARLEVAYAGQVAHG
ncbi:MAG TPA: hypothetical protein VHI93_02465, partial [Candidatus Thermoplasmatota archaeon]|nr:hypothetical protein [Candidatus Thermoplasmatota archaeon]